MEPVDNPTLFSFLDVFKTGGPGILPIFSLGETGNLSVTGTVQAQDFITSSDARLKTNIVQLTGVLEKVEKIRGASFAWNDVYKSLGHATERREIGLIAQEVEAVFPELVTLTINRRHDSYKAINYGRIAGVLIEAVKELKAETDAQQKHIAALEARLVVLEHAVKTSGAPAQMSSSVLSAGWPLFVGLLLVGLALG